MKKILIGIFLALRPRQWLKNLALFAPLVLSGRLFWPGLFTKSLLGVAVFCLLSSSNYLLNDVIDLPRDRQDPFKKFRPIASGIVSSKLALFTALGLLIAGLGLSFRIGPNFLLIACGFVLLHWFSYFFFRHIGVLDVIALSGGYLLRVAAGEVTSDYHISVWLFLTVLAFSLLLAIGKRRTELTIIKEHEEKYKLEPEEFIYSEKLLDTYVAVFANATFLTYTYFTFLSTPTGGGSIFFREDSWASFIGRKWLMATIPFVLFGVLRYLQIIYEIKEGVLEKIIVKDKPLLISVALWIITVLVVIYGL